MYIMTFMIIPYNNPVLSNYYNPYTLLYPVNRHMLLLNKHSSELHVLCS